MKRVHLILSDTQHNEWSKLKDELGLTWEGFVEHAVSCLPTTTVSGEEEE